jgi:hypothetical protein
MAMEQPMEVNVEGFHYATLCKKGRREFMEDTHKAIVNVLGHSKHAFFGVFDGHSGRKAMKRKGTLFGFQGGAVRTHIDID